MRQGITNFAGARSTRNANIGPGGGTTAGGEAETASGRSAIGLASGTTAACRRTVTTCSIGRAVSDGFRTGDTGLAAGGSGAGATGAAGGGASGAGDAMVSFGGMIGASGGRSEGSDELIGVTSG